MWDVVRAARLSLALSALSRYNPEMPPRDLYRVIFTAEVGEAVRYLRGMLIITNRGTLIIATP